MSNNSSVMGGGSPLSEEVLAPIKTKGRVGEFIRKFCKQRMPLVATCFFILLFLVGIFGPFLTPYNPNEPNYDALMTGPFAAEWGGTDEYGRDILSRLMDGTRLTLAVSLSAVMIAAVLGTILGLL